jgi:KUP system potassium uptake protein
VVRQRWDWPRGRALLVVAPLLAVDVAFFAANVPKIPQGGWFPLVIAVGLVVQMATWRRGRQLVAARIRRTERRLTDSRTELDGATVVPGTAVFLCKDTGVAPPALLNNLRHNRVRHATTVILSVFTDDVPRVEDAARADVQQVGDGLYTVKLHFGFMEEPDVPATLAQIGQATLPMDPDVTTYFIGRESVLASNLEGMPLPLERLFVLLHRGADSAARFFNLPPDQIFEVGAHVEI